MIDHEIRIITKSVNNLIKKKSSYSEKILKKKISFNFISSKNFLVSYKNYLSAAKKINEVYIRGLPINNKKIFLNQEIELKDSFKKIITKINKKINYKQIVQIPNPDFVSIKEFEKTINKINNLGGFELISSWHDKRSDDKKYFKFFSLVQDSGLPLSLEVDYFYRSSKNSIIEFMNVLKKFPNIQFWLPHFGCGIFLHWDKIENITNKPPVLLSSTNEIEKWLFILKKDYFKKIPIKFASDHPFNELKSIHIYKTWIKYNN